MSLALAIPSATVLPTASTTVAVQFAPTTGGIKTAAIRIANNTPGKNPFDINLTGERLSATVDTDGDGMPDVAELLPAPLGFDWQVSQPAEVGTYYANANVAGLYTPSQVQAIHLDVSLMQRNATTGKFTLTIGIGKSTDLTQWEPFPFTVPETTVNGQGEIEFEFTGPGDAAFFRLEGQ